MRFFITAVVGIILIVAAAVMPLSAQESSQEYTAGPSASESAPQNNSAFNWPILYSIWMVPVAALFTLFYLHRRRKRKALATEKSEPGKESPPEFNKTEKRVIVVAFGMLIFATSIFLINALWTLLFFVLGSMAALYAIFPEIVSELLRAVQPSDNTADNRVKTETTFKNVGGLDEVIEELQEIVFLLKNPEEAEDWDIAPPKGILLYGPPGCGKTLLARAVAGEAGIPLFQHSGGGIGGMYVRSGADEVEKIFTDALAKAPCVLFIDEFDGLGRRRGQDTSGEFDHALTELLHQMDGINEKSGIFVIAATNREDSIDEALLRPGRFGRGILVPPPDKNGRLAILKIHTAKRAAKQRLGQDVNLEELAERIPGFTGDDIRELANKAGKIARRRYEAAKKERGIVEMMVGSVKELFAGQKIVTKEDFEKALDEIRGGLARKPVLNFSEQKIIAWHEMGHAIVTAEKKLEVLEKITLTQRNWALGMTLSRAEETHLFSKAVVLARITSLLGGRAAEKIFLGPEKITTSATNDFEKAAELCRRMVCEWGMGESGPAVFAKLDSSRPWTKPFSEHAARKIDKEVQKIMDACMREAEAIVEENKEIAEYMAELLVQKVTIGGKEFMDILKEKKGQIN